MLHKSATLGDRHAVHNWEVADYAALAALVVTSADKGKMAQVASPASYYILFDNVGPVWVQIDPGLKFFSFQKTADLVVGAGVARWYPPQNCVIVTIEAWVGTAPTGTNLIAAIKKNGATTLATLTIVAGSNTMADSAVALTLLTTDYLTIDITQIGSVVAGKDLVIRLGVH